MVTLEPLNNPTGNTQQEYDTTQEALIPIISSPSEFNPEKDKVVFSLETIGGDLLYTNPSPNFTIRNYQNSSDPNSISSVVVFPIQDTERAGYTVGSYNAYYNFYKTALNSTQYQYFIKEISPNRTEIRLSVNNVDNEEIQSLFQSFSSSLQTKEDLFKDFYLNIGNAYFIATNTFLDTAGENYTILIKLYQPLPADISTNTQAKVVLEAAETVGFNITFPPTPIEIDGDVEYIKGPNFNLQFNDEVNNSTIEYDYDTLINNTELTSSYNELQNILAQKGIKVNIDYTDFSNFIHFSSAEQRILNFYYKVGLIESASNEITNLLTITGSTSASVEVTSSILNHENTITNIISNFDGYENYLYYTSESLSYPKSNSTQPYTLQSTGSAETLIWLESLTGSAATYDSENQNNLWYSVPTYLREDPINDNYRLFLNMIGQHFDILFSYTNTITDKYNTDHRLDKGISKDLVGDALKSMGLKLYQNNFSTDDLYSSLLGINASGSLLPPTGSELIETYITASNSAIPLDDLNKETYKRLYHNLPYLLKKKGTVEGLRALITCFGIPDTILRITEFGGKDKINLNVKDYTREVFDLDTGTTSSVSSSQPLVGIKNRISDKIRIYTGSIVEGDTLSFYRTLQSSSEEYTNDVNYVEVAFSPQNEINDLLTASFNIGEYIGDPAFQSSSLTSYPALDQYRDSIFEDLGFLSSSYDWNDYIRIIKYFDNSLFRMIKDFTPARSGVSTGVVIKQHMLERNRVRPPQIETSQHDYSGSVYSQQIWDPISEDTIISSSLINKTIGGTGGVFNDLNNGYSNASVITLRGATASILRRDGFIEFINFNSFKIGSGDLGVTGSKGGLEVNDTLYSFKNTTTTPIQFDFSLEGVVADSSIDAGEIQIFSDRRFTTSSSEFLDKRNAGAIYSASLGNIPANNPISINAQNLIIYPEESLCITLSDSDSNAEKIIGCDVTFSYSKLNNNPTLNTQYWQYSVDTPLGPAVITQSTQDEFYNGELNGSDILVTDGNLNNTRVIETANINEGFIAPYNDVYSNEYYNSDGFFTYYTNEDFTQITSLAFHGNDSTGDSRFNFLSNFPNNLPFNPGDSLYIRTIETDGTEKLFTFQIETVYNGPAGNPNPGSTQFTVTPFGNPAYGGLPSPWNQSNGNPKDFTIEVIRDPSITNLQANLKGDEPLQNNVDIPVLSNTYMDIDYSTSMTKPINFSQLINNTAVKAPVQDSNYSQKGWSNSRYNGSRMSSPDFNVIV